MNMYCKQKELFIIPSQLRKCAYGILLAPQSLIDAISGVGEIIK